MNDDIDKYINKRKSIDLEFADGFDEGYDNFKIGYMLRQIREKEGLTQEEIARRLNTKKSAISRMENHSEDIRFSTLKNYARILNKKLILNII